MALYLEDPYCRVFEARIEEKRLTEAGWEVALDRTCFYPTGGGQPADRGTLGGAPVLDVREEDGRIWHLLAELPADALLRGELDWGRRFDHMQQHSGQHILSAVALERQGAQTVSFHLGTESATIDLDISGLSPSEVQAMEDETNGDVVGDIPVRCFFVDPEDAPRLNLRKPLTKGERPRIVEIEGVDRSPCGGTHVGRTGQVGAIKVRRVERYKDGVRLEFLCGWRALRDYQWKHLAIAGLARDLTVADREAEAAIRRLLGSEKEARRQVELLRGQLFRFEAAALRSAAATAGKVRFVTRAFEERPPAEVKQLAGLLAAEPGTVALLAAQAPSVRFFFARSADVDLDMRELLRSVTQRYGGGGGGRPEGAEGGGMPSERTAEALAWAVQQLAGRLTDRSDR